MDQDRKDQMARDFIDRAMTRRRVLGTALGGAVGGALLLAGCGSSGSGGGGGGTTAAGTAVSTAAVGTPRYGGDFKWAVSGGGTADFIDGQSTNDWLTIGRQSIGWDGLMFSDQWGEPQPALATEVTPNADASEWTIVLRDGVEFHNGKTLTADDVVYSLRRAVDPELAAAGGSSLVGSIDPKQVTKIDDKTVRITLTAPNALIPLSFTRRSLGIVPEGYAPNGIGKAKNADQIGTGPFKLDSFAPGEQSVHVRNPNYWREGEPYFDSVTVVPITDTTARVNALLSGQLHAVGLVPPEQVAAVQQAGKFQVFENKSGSPILFSMNVTEKPFDDVRVRQAMRLIIDREQLVNQVLSGNAEVGNDLLTATIDPAYNTSLTQRGPDIEQAKSLLKAAGYENLQIDLPTVDWTAGQNKASQIFGQQAKAAGVTVNVKEMDASAWFGGWLKWPFTATLWSAKPYWLHVGEVMLPTSASNETHWPDKANANYVDLASKARTTLDPAARQEIFNEMQLIEWENGGYINWAYPTMFNAVSNDVAGFVGNGYKPLAPLEDFGNGFRSQWFVA